MTRQQWTTSGPNPCNICLSLDGQIADEGEPFTYRDNQDNTVSIYVPPDHPGCLCTLVNVEDDAEATEANQTKPMPTPIPDQPTGERERFQLATSQLSFNLAPSDKPQGVARIYAARVMRAGTPNGWKVSPAVLLASADKWNGVGVYVDHPAFYESPSIRNFVGAIRNASFEGPDSLTAQLHLFDINQSQETIELLDLLISQRDAALPTPPVGLSAVLSLVWEYDEAAGTRTVTEISKVWSVDIVHEPAADGHVTKILNSQSQSVNPIMEPITSPAPAPITLAPLAITQPAPTNTPDTVTLTNALLHAQCDQLLSMKLDGSSKFPDAVKSAIRAKFTNPDGTTRLFSPDELTREINSANTIAAAFSGDVIQGMGTPASGAQRTQISMWSDMDRLQTAYDAMMGLRPEANAPRDVPKLTGIRELYHLVTGDRDMHGRFDSGRAMFANATSTTLAELTRNVINKVVSQTWSEMTDYRWWERIVAQYDFASLKDISWVTVGGFGDLATVTEGASYPELTWDDNRETSSWLKKGGYLGMTLEMIDKDDTGKWASVPKAMAIAALRTLSASVGNILTQSSGVGPTLADSLALFHTTHANLTTTALSAAQWDVVTQAVFKQTELNSARRLALRPSLLVVPIELRKTALSIFGSAQEPGGANNDINVAGWSQNFQTDNVIVCPEMTDANDWAALVDPRIAPALGVGFRFGRQPESFVAGDPLSYLMFHNDVMPIKVRFFYNVGVVDYRPVHKANVA